MQRTLLTLASTCIIGLLAAQTGPEITSWMINTTGATGYNNLPANVQQVQYSANFVYVDCSGIPAYSIGPWNMNPNVPSDQGYTFKIPRNPQQNTGTLTATPLGNIGVFINGVTMFNAKDAFSYNNQNIWHQNAVVVEAPTFDACLGHPAPGGSYHNHQNPSCLYTAVPTQHSGILGYAFDGFPVYGPYAYTNTNGTGAITRMRSSYQLRSITVRQTLPDGTTLQPSQYGPAVSTQYPLGYYIEDFEYVQNLGDLDEHNGRFCVTPEYPAGIYAYFVTIDANGNSEYPYMIGPEYYGIVETGNIGPGGGHVTISESVTTYTPNSIAENAAAKTDFNLFPNPADELVQLSLAQPAQEDVQLRIANQLGQNVLSETLAAGTTELRVNISAFAPGLYFITLESAAGRVTQKLSIR